MVMQASGVITLAQVQTEHGGAHPIGMNEYYGRSGVPASGVISLYNFYNSCNCQCNYCPCNCNYCPCNCNYACTCNCNYSDERLKTNIVYM